MFKGCEILVEDVMLKANLIPLEMSDSDIILGMDWLSNHRVSMDCFTKKIVFKKLRYPEIEFEGYRRILLTCVTFALEAKKLLHKGSKAYLAHVINKSLFEVTLDNVPILYEFSEDLSSLPQIENWSLG